MAKKDEKQREGVLTPRQQRYAIVTGILILVLLSIAAAFVYRVYLKTESSCYDDLAVQTENAIDGLEANLRSDRTMLRVIAGLIGNAEDIDSIEVSGYLANYDINSMITQIGVLLPEDRVVLSKGLRSNFEGKLDFEHESILGEHISGPQPSAANPNINVIRSYVPIRKDGICIGVLYSAANPENIAKAWIPSIYEKKGYCYVVDRRTGEIIINSSNDQIRNINDIAFTQINSSYTKEGTISDILGGKKGYSVFNSDAKSENLYMCYLPFDIEDWEMVALVPESAVFSDVTPIRAGVYKIIVLFAILVLIYSIWLIREIRASIAETEHKANTDALTGLQNRNRYEAYLKKLEGTADRIICIYIDVNGLHEVNNSKGHYAGDQMLRFIADTLKIEFGGDHIYRIGGDEFIVFESGKTESEVNACLAGFNDALQRNDYHAAVGIAIRSGDMSMDALIKNAEQEMYEAKQKYYEQIGKAMRV
ncbi:MAG: diguanylate cyclase [Oscillospiraceae bacterium]|nr:diguanylate cyclase [Oscillospiraceae bacterium]